MTARSLLVIDLDSALCDREGRASLRDRAALARAAEPGGHVAFATSQRTAAAIERLRSLSLRGWVIGADGAEIAGVDGSRVTRHVLPSTVATRCAARMRAQGLSVFALTSQALHGEAELRGVAAESIGPIADVYSAVPPRLADIQALAATGPWESVRDASRQLETESPTRIAARHFRSGPLHAVRVRSVRATRAKAIEEICARLGVRRSGAAYVGGAVHPAGDLGAFVGAGRTYCVAGVPDEIAHGAHRLASPAGEGAIAEALDRWRDSCRDAAASAGKKR